MWEVTGMSVYHCHKFKMFLCRFCSSQLGKWGCGVSLWPTYLAHQLVLHWQKASGSSGNGGAGRPS